MGNIKTQDLENCQSVEQAVNLVCSKSWGAAILDKQNSKVFTNKPGFFIGRKGANIRAMKHLNSNLKVSSFDELDGVENHLIKTGTTFHPLILEQLNKDGVPCFTANAAPTGGNPELFTVSTNILNWILKGLENQTLQLINVQVFKNQ